MLQKMILLLLLAVLVVFKPSPAVSVDQYPVFLNQTELSAIDEALDNLKMDRRDLEFKRDYIADDYRMKVCQMVLEKPMLAPDYSDDLYQFVKLNSVNLDLILTRAFSDMDYSRPVKTPPPVPEQVKNLDELKIVSGQVDPSIHNVLVEYVIDMYQVNALLQRSFAPLSLQDIAFLEEYTPKILLQDTGTQKDEQEEETAEQFYANTEKYLKLWKSLDLNSLANASILYAKVNQDFIKAISEVTGDEPQKNKKFIKGCEIETRLGMIYIGTGNHDVFSKRAFLILDPGGDDFYTFADQPEMFNLSTIIDLGGDDYYKSTSDNSFGAGYYGIGGLFDFSGNDIYTSGNFSLGSGLFGTGILIDSKGNDIFKSDSLGQGSGAFGFGYLADLDGDDTYTGAFEVQGFAFTGGMGILLDNTGDDSYWAGGKYPDDPRYPDRYVSLSQGFSIGIRPIASGGIGALFDCEGSDNYWTDVYGQGVSYWFSLGILVDGAGHDWYESHQYNQGSGIHLSTGVLIDYSGDDRYNGKNLSQGNAHDYAVGWLIDRAGNDFYACNSLSLGAANANAVAFFIDDSGNDYYFAGETSASIAWSNELREFGGIGIFIDLGGLDKYTNDVHDGDIWVQSKYACGIDRLDPVKEEKKPE